MQAVVARAAARPTWCPGYDTPAHLDGSLPGDYGFDPLGLGAEPDALKWCVCYAIRVLYLLIRLSTCLPLEESKPDLHGS